MNAALSAILYSLAAPLRAPALRFYLAAAVVIGGTAPAAAQPPAASAPADRPPLGSSMTVEALGTLPSSGSISGLLDTTIPDVISDRIDTGGLSTGEASRVGAHGSSWTQTTYRVGDADVTDPSGSGTPLLVPTIAEWERVDVSTGIMPPDPSPPGMAVSLFPRRPGNAWTGSLDAFGSPAVVNAGPHTDAPIPLERLNTWANAALAAGGPVSDRLGAFAAAVWTRASKFERERIDPVDASLASGFLTLTGAPQRGSASQLRVTGWVQRTRTPMTQHLALRQFDAGERHRALHAQASWNRPLASGDGLRAFGSYTVRGRSSDPVSARTVTIERLLDGPVPSLLDAGDGRDAVLNAGARFNRSADGSTHHDLLAGVDVTRASSGLQSAFTGRVGELVNGTPARAWDLVDPAAESSWRSTTLAAFVSDTAALSSRVTVNGSVRFEAIRGYQKGTDGAAISWNDLLPRAGLHVALTRFWNIATFAQYGRYGHRLPLRDLAYGDPDAPYGLVYRWNGGNLQQPGSIGPLVQRIGPGTAGRPGFSGIDPELRRPTMHEVIFGFESRPHPSAFARMAAIARREWPLVGVANVGVTEAMYSTRTVFDTGIDRIGSEDDQMLVFYNRPASTFGADTYLLTNPDDHVATFVGVDFVGQVHARRLFLIAGGTAGRSEGLSANRGFGPIENDYAVLGEVFVNPNARAHAQGRAFTERGYTIKTAMSYQFDHDVTFGIVGRYQDGQHFSRLVVLDTLDQGPEAVRAFRNGRTRFTFTMTVDARLQKGFSVGGTRRLTAVLDAYNLFNQKLSIEELQVTGAGPRVETAVQPPRVIHFGVKIPF